MLACIRSAIHDSHQFHCYETKPQTPLRLQKEHGELPLFQMQLHYLVAHCNEGLQCPTSGAYSHLGSKLQSEAPVSDCARHSVSSLSH